MGHITAVVNENIGISEDLRVDIFLNFELYDPVHVPGAITDSNQITFFRDPSDPKTITGFSIKVIDPDDQKYKEATALGERIVNLLCAMTGVVVKSKRPKISGKAENMPQITPTNTPNKQGFGLDASTLPSLVSGNELLNKKVESYQRGMAALEDNDPKNAIPAFYQVFEKRGDKTSDYYQSLRDACSHVVLNSANTVNALNNNFNITCTVHNPVDFTNVDNWQQLYKHAHTLKQVADNHLKKILP